MTFLTVPQGQYKIGTTLEGVRNCVKLWQSRLINPCYGTKEFEQWIAKEFPAHVIESVDFELQETLVSNADVRAYIADTGAEVPESIAIDAPEDHPVWGVSIDWAKNYALWMSEKDSSSIYRLPTESEWEIAARGSDFREYPYGHHFNSQCANTIESGFGSTTAVDFFSSTPGPFGHLDLAGNVEEWVDSQYCVYAGGVTIEDDLYQRFGMNYFILRGGSFACGGDLSRSARRHGPFPDPLFRFTGFRLVRERKLVGELSL